VSARGASPWLTIVALSVGLALAATGASATLSAAQRWTKLAYAPAPADNPLKGFAPYQGTYNKFPHSLEWNTLPWKDVQTDEHEFSWDAIDQLLADVSSRGHQTAFRIYADYPDQPYAVPAFLEHVAKHSYTDFSNGTHHESFAPDYNNPALVAAMLETISALGARYDGDPRIGFITVGFLGFWGEWHTFRPSCACDTWMPSAAVETAVLDTFDRAFNRTRLLVRNPDVGWSGQAIGFHDDSFAEQTISPPDWMFTGRLRKAGATTQWEREPIGGELAPARQPCTFDLPACNPPGQEFGRSVDATHASWLVNHHAFQAGYEPEAFTRAVAGARRLGYELFVSAVRCPDATTGGRFDVDVRMQNRGVAPFYYDWTVQLGVADETGGLVASYDTSWRLTRVVRRGVDIELSHELRVDLPSGRYTLLMRVINPLAKGMQLAFANQTWGTNLSGWLTLRTFTVRRG